MPTKLTTTISKIACIPNSVNSELVNNFYEYMKSNGASERHQNNNLKAVIAYAKFLGPDFSFYDVQKKEQIIAFLDTKIKNAEIDPDKKWITTWNHNLHRIKHFFRWLHNYGHKKEEERVEQSEWETPSFARIKEKRTKRISPYSETELWERDEILSIVKYEPYLRNKSPLTLFWDLDARNHEITLLKIKHIRLLERYGEGEIPSSFSS